MHVAVSVVDEGPGVPPDLLPHLFRKHADLGNRERGGGFGLGLLICKGLVEAHGGRIWAESGGAGRGTRFTFTVPVAEETDGGSAAGLAPDRSRRSREARERTPILVVDDDPQMVRYVRDVLAAADYARVVTGDPEELPALVRAQESRTSSSRTEARQSSRGTARATAR